MKYNRILLSLIGFTTVFSAVAQGAAHKYQKNSPLFYARLADVADHVGSGCSSRMRYLFENGYGEKSATLLKKGKFKHEGYGTFDFIVVKDDKNLVHVAIKGDYEGHSLMSFKDIPTNVLKNIQQRISKCEEKYGKITTIIGHALGGGIASQLVKKYKGKYQNVQVITFNGFCVKKGDNQLHFLFKHADLKKWVTPLNNYKKLDHSNCSVEFDEEMGKFLKMKLIDWNKV